MINISLQVPNAHIRHYPFKTYQNAGPRHLQLAVRIAANSIDQGGENPDRWRVLVEEWDLWNSTLSVCVAASRCEFRDLCSFCLPLLAAY